MTDMTNDAAVAPVPTTNKVDADAANAAAADLLTARLASLDVTEEQTDPTLHTGELIVRQAGFPSMGDCAMEEATSFSSLSISDALKKSIADIGWQSMSKIQRRALPLLLNTVPAHCIAQAQAGTGKTGTFVIAALAKVDHVERASQPQVIILALTQELVTQIAQVVQSLGKDSGMKARRVMGTANQGGGGGGRGRGRGQMQMPQQQQPSWAMASGEDFLEQVVVGTPGKVVQLIESFAKGRKPYIDPCEVRVVVLDEADQMVQPSPIGQGEAVFTIRDAVLTARRGNPIQLLLFSATYTDEARDLAQKFVGGDKAKYHEILLKREDQTLDNVENFFVFVGHAGDGEDQIRAAKFEAVVKLWEALADSPIFGQTVIFVETRARARELAEFLRSRGYEVGQIHADMDKIERETVFREFKENKRPALIATNVLSRGIDNPNVTLVINVDLPVKKSGESDPETFVHRIGRSGRWTKRGASLSLVAAGESRDKRTMAEIERALFANDAMDRPLIPVADPSLITEALKKRTEERKKKQAPATAS